MNQLKKIPLDTLKIQLLSLSFVWSSSFYVETPGNGIIIYIRYHWNISQRNETQESSIIRSTDWLLSNIRLKSNFQISKFPFFRYQFCNQFQQREEKGIFKPSHKSISKKAIQHNYLFVVKNITWDSTRHHFPFIHVGRAYRIEIKLYGERPLCNNNNKRRQRQKQQR